MSKKLLVFCVVLLSFAAAVSAKNALTLDVGGLYTNFSTHDIQNISSTSHWANTGGFNFGLRYEIVKNFGAYSLFDFSFSGVRNRGATVHGNQSYTYSRTWNSVDLIYVIDSQLGFFYQVRLPKKIDIFVGAGLGIGGGGLKNQKAIAPQLQEEYLVNIGGGINIDVGYMLSDMVGLYCGFVDTMYAVVKQSGTRLLTGHFTNTGPSVQERFANSFTIKAGIRLVF